MYTHYRIWKHVVEEGYKRVAVLEDDVQFTKQALALLPKLFQNIDQETTKRGKMWHYLFFRRHALRNVKDETVSFSSRAKGCTLRARLLFAFDEKAIRWNAIPCEFHAYFLICHFKICLLNFLEIL